MKAVCWKGKHDVAVEEVPDPKIEHPRDAIVRITSTAICGSDLHLYDGVVQTMERGDILGHEFMGEIVELVPEVTNLKVGDRVIVPFFLDKIPYGAAFAKGLTFKMGQTHVQRYTRPLLERIESGKIDPSFLITHVLPLDSAPEAYETFKQKKDGCIKVVMKPFETTTPGKVQSFAHELKS